MGERDSATPITRKAKLSRFRFRPLPRSTNSMNRKTTPDHYKQEVQNASFSNLDAGVSLRSAAGVSTVSASSAATEAGMGRQASSAGRGRAITKGRVRNMTAAVIAFHAANRVCDVGMIPMESSRKRRGVAMTRPMDADSP